MAPRNATASRAKRGFAAVIVIAILLFLALTAAWYYLANRLDEQVSEVVEAAAERGTILVCEGREIFGYPFRLGLSCDATRFEQPERGISASAGALRTAAQIYRPNRIVAELDAPLSVRWPDGTAVDLGWTLAQASAVFWTEGLDRFDVAIERPELSLTAPGQESVGVYDGGHAELHARRRDDDLDMALSGRGIRLTLPGTPELPLFDNGLDLTIAGAADWLTRGAPEGGLAEALRGRSGLLRSARIDFGDAGAELNGNFSVSEAGLVSGEFELALAQPERIADLVAGLAPELSTVARTVAGAISFVGRNENGRSVIPLTVRDGEISSGFIPLGSLPPLE